MKLGESKDINFAYTWNVANGTLSGMASFGRTQASSSSAAPPSVSATITLKKWVGTATLLFPITWYLEKDSVLYDRRTRYFYIDTHLTYFFPSAGSCAGRQSGPVHTYTFLYSLVKLRVYRSRCSHLSRLKPLPTCVRAVDRNSLMRIHYKTKTELTAYEFTRALGKMAFLMGLLSRP